MSETEGGVREWRWGDWGGGGIFTSLTVVKYNNLRLIVYDTYMINIGL